ncbi:hypothetical protein RCZ04_15910 [Capnocytophaga sp. HP1101]
MKKVITVMAIAVVFSSCNFFSNKAKEAAETTEDVANKTATKAGEIVGGTVRSFGDGVGEGIDKSGNSMLKLSEALTQRGLKLGHHTVDSQEGNDNKLSLYFIFEKDFEGTVMVRVLNKQDVEVGRVRQEIKGKKGDATFFDFVFDPRTNIDPKYTIIIE